MISFVTRLKTLERQVYTTGHPVVLPFLSMNEIDLLSVLDTRLVSYRLDGGWEEAEYKRAVILPIGYDQIDCQVALMHFSYPSKFLSIQHRNVLGSILALGISRDRIGDIVVEEGQVIFATTKELVSFFQQEFTEIHGSGIEVKEYHGAVHVLDQGVEKKVFVTSLRIDTVIAQAFSLSREEANEYIKREMVKYNGKIVLKSFQSCEECAIISVRTKGRVKLLQNSGLTKSGRHCLLLKIYR